MYAEKWVFQNGMKAINVRRFGCSLPIMPVTRKAGRQPRLAELFTDILLALYPAKLP